MRRRDESVLRPPDHRGLNGPTRVLPVVTGRARHARGRRVPGGGPSARRRAESSALVLTGLVLPLVLATAVASASNVAAATPLPPPDSSEFGATGELPGALPEVPPPAAGGPALGEGTGIPEVVLAAYRGAEERLTADAPGCRLPWSLVAGIGKVESDHARNGSVDPAGVATPTILGPVLTGDGGTAAIADTDQGALDGDATWDRAVGPTQFLPATWAKYGTDGDRDGRSDPNDVADAAAGTGRYLCAGTGDITDPARRHDAVFRYNHSEAYVADVLAWADAYSAGVSGVPGDLALAGGPTDGPGPIDGTVPTGATAVAAAPVGALPPAPEAPIGGLLPVGEGGVTVAGGGAAASMGSDIPVTAPETDLAPTPGTTLPTRTTTSGPTVSRTTAALPTSARRCRLTFTPEYVDLLLSTPVGVTPELAPVDVAGNRTTCTLTSGGVVYLVLEVVERPTDADRAQARAFAPAGELVEAPDWQRYMTITADRIVSIEVTGGARATERSLKGLALRHGG